MIYTIYLTHWSTLLELLLMLKQVIDNQGDHYGGSVLLLLDALCHHLHGRHPRPWRGELSHSEICRRSIDQSWISQRNSDWFFVEHSVVHHSAATPVCQVGDSVEPSDIPGHEPHGGYLHYQHQYQNTFCVRLMIAISVILFFLVIVDWPSSSKLLSSTTWLSSSSWSSSP